MLSSSESSEGEAQGALAVVPIRDRGGVEEPQKFWGFLRSSVGGDWVVAVRLDWFSIWHILSPEQQAMCDNIYLGP